MRDGSEEVDEQLGSTDKEISEICTKIQRIPKLEQAIERMSNQMEDNQRALASLVTEMAANKIWASSSMGMESVY